ncbi:MAG: Sec-independent protein translocase protein TatB [Paracoccaceae bacterium]|jgi:sec-independent protein translocase protein TatB|tara:strand:+ start:667 stop:1134 length:468 start_codon:yes stop_codon:yes gene_type:complete
MFDLGWTELLLIGIVALIVVGPKELPVLFRKAGQFVGKIKGMAREFSRAMNNAADDVGVSDISSTIRSAANPLKSSVDAVKNAATDYTSYDPETETGQLAGKRAEQAKKIKEHSEKKAQEKLDKSADKNLADDLPKKGKSSKGKKNVSSDKLENS